jgi:hypothetical protein
MSSSCGPFFGEPASAATRGGGFFTAAAGVTDGEPAALAAGADGSGVGAGVESGDAASALGTGEGAGGATAVGAGAGALRRP